MREHKLRDFFKYKIPNFFRSIIYNIKKPFIIVRNYFFCKKYPFYKSRNVWTDEFLGYEFTWYDAIPKGWRKAFGKELSNELREQLIQDNQLYDFRFTEIKEKWGKLCLYNSGGSEGLLKTISYYEDYSICYCIECGKPARFCADGYLEYLCENCAKKHINYKKKMAKRYNTNTDEINIEKWKLTKEDIPHTTYFDENGKSYTEISSGIDYETLWDIDND